MFQDYRIYTRGCLLLLTEAFYYVEIPIKDLASEEKNAITKMRVPMVLPHELMCYLIVSLAIKLVAP